MKNSKIFPMVMVGVFAAVLAVLSLLSIPMPTGVPITLQTFAVALCGYVLGTKRGTAATAVYIALGAVGLPVFAGFSSGIGVIIGMTGGFLWGFLPMAALCGVGFRAEKRPLAVLLGLLGLAICHLFGTVQFSIVAGSGVFESFLLVSVPYLIKDVLSVAAAYAVSVLLRVGLKKGGIALDA